MAGGISKRKTTGVTTAGPTHGWAAVFDFARGGLRWHGAGERLRVVALHVERPTGAGVDERCEFLRRAVREVPPDGPTIYLTPAGFFGLDAGRGDSANEESLRWREIDPKAVKAKVGRLAASLPPDVRVVVGVDLGTEYEQQYQWWFTGGNRNPTATVQRECDNLEKRRFDVGGFKVMSFVCGELHDGGSGFEAETHTKGLDLVLDLAHASVNRVWKRSAYPFPRWAFHRAFADIGKHCGAVLAHACQADDGEEHIRRQHNWVVFRGQHPFPECEKSHRIG